MCIRNEKGGSGERSLVQHISKLVQMVTFKAHLSSSFAGL